MQININHSRARSSGFTLIELLITVSLIIILVATVIPKVDNFGDRITSNNKIEEIESLINLQISLLKNPDQGATYYQVRVDDSQRVGLYSNLSPSVPIRKVLLDSNESVSMFARIKYLRCNVPYSARDCNFYDTSDAVVPSSTHVFLNYHHVTMGDREIKVLFDPLMVQPQ